MKASEVIKKAIEPDMPDMEAVRKKCLKELHRGEEEDREEDEKQLDQNAEKFVYTGLGLYIAAIICILLLPAHSDAEAFIARLQTWLRLDHGSVSAGELKPNYIHIPEDCQEVEYDGEIYLTKKYASLEELEEDIGKHLVLWRETEEFQGGDIMLSIVEGKYAKISIFYDISVEEMAENAEPGDGIQKLDYFVTIPLSEDFSMNTMKRKNEHLKSAIFDTEGNIIGYGKNDVYSLMETYHSAGLNTDVSVIGKKMKGDSSMEEYGADSYYYYLYFVRGGRSYQVNCYSNLEAAEFAVEELK